MQLAFPARLRLVLIPREHGPFPEWKQEGVARLEGLDLKTAI